MCVTENDLQTFLKGILTSSRRRANTDQMIKVFHCLFNTSRSTAIGNLLRKNTDFKSGEYFFGQQIITKRLRLKVTYPTRTENGHPTRAPAATPRMANGGES